MGFSSITFSDTPARDTDPSTARPSKLARASFAKSPGPDIHPSRLASISTASKPMLWRVPAYCLPGSPRPTISFIPCSAGFQPAMQSGKTALQKSFLLRRGFLLAGTRRRSRRRSTFGRFFAFSDLATDDFGLGRAFGFNHLGRSDFEHFLHRRDDQLTILHGLHARRQLDVLDGQDVVERYVGDVVANRLGNFQHETFNFQSSDNLREHAPFFSALGLAFELERHGHGHAL